jgi:ketosteroid isomerase-like protein
MPVRWRLAAFALAGLGLSACQPLSERLADADRDTIHAAVNNFTKAVLASDFTTAASYYAEDGMMMPPNAPVVEGRSAISSFLAGFPKITAFSQKIVELEANGDLAYARLTYTLTTMPPGAKAPLTDTGKIIIIMRKQPNATWLTTRGIWNSDLTGRTIIT